MRPYNPGMNRTKFAKWIIAALAWLLCMQLAFGQDSLTTAQPSDIPDTSATTKPAADAPQGIRLTIPKKHHPQDDQSPPHSVDGIYESLDLSETQRQVLINIERNRSSHQESGFYMMMAKVAEFPNLKADQRKELPQIPVPTLKREPKRNQFRPLRTTVRVYRIQKLTLANKQISPNPYWPSKMPLYRIDVASGLPDDPEQQNLQSMVLYSPIKPPKLPEPNKMQPDGSEEYLGPYFDICGVFYKLLELPSQGDANQPSQLRTYPVILTWQIEPAHKFGRSDPSDWVKNGVIFLIIVLAAVIVLFLHKQNKKYRSKNEKDKPLFQNYAPLRGEEDIEDEDLGPIDPDLTAAATDYRRKHNLPIRDTQPLPEIPGQDKQE